MATKKDYEKYLNYIDGVRFWLITTGIIITFAALKAASNIVNMLLLASFLTAISLAPLSWLKKKGLNGKLATAIVIVMIIVVFGLINLVIAASVNGFIKKMPVYEEKFTEMWKNTEHTLINYGLVNKEDFEEGDLLPAKTLLPMAAPLASGFGSVLSSAVIIFILFIFMISEEEMIARKVAFISSGSSGQFNKVLKQLRNYFGIKTLTSLGTGISIGLMLFILDVDFPVLWGFLAFVLNYIPSIGSFIAAIPAVLLTFIMKGPVTGIIVSGAYLVINTLIGNVIEPQLMGKNLGISPFVVFFSMILFGYILGPVGMLIATPMAIVIKIIFDSREVTRGLGILISDGKVLEELEKKSTLKKKEKDNDL